MQNKDHIWRLPTEIDYAALLPNSRKPKTESQVAISIPLFSSSFQFIKEAKSREYFQQVHVKGAVWAALAMLNNTDLGENGVQTYFHVEETVLKSAKVIFDAMHVPEEYIRVINTADIHAKVKNIKNLRYGKKFACLFDDLPIDNWLVMDSDAFACTRDEKIKLYAIFDSPWTESNPISFNYYLNQFDYEHWIDRIYNAIGKVPKKSELWEQEVAAFKDVGLEINNNSDKGKEQVIRPTNKTVLFALNKNSELADFLRQNLNKCCEDEFLIAMWSLQNPILSLSSMLYLPMFYSGGEYINGDAQQYFHHVIFEAMDSNPFFTRFYKDMTRHIPLQPSTALTTWENLYSKEDNNKWTATTTSQKI